MNTEELRRDIETAPNRASYQVAETIDRLTDCIYDIMREQGLNNAGLAARIGRSRAWVGKLLGGDHNMTVKTAVTIFHALGHRLDFAVGPSVEYEVAGIASETVAGTAYSEVHEINEFAKAA